MCISNSTKKTFAMYLLVAAILCLTAVPVTPSYHEIHKQMTPLQVQKVFGTTHDNVPSYKLVNVEVSSMQKRDKQYRRPVRIHGHGMDINLLLKRTDGFLAGENTLVTAAVVTENDVQYRNYPDAMKRVGEQLEDPNGTGSLLILSRNRDRRYALDGHIESENLLIRSLPEELVDSLYSNDLNHHVIFEPKMEPFKPDHADNLLNVTQLRLALSRNTGSVPTIIYPEILLVVDASSFKLHGNIVGAVRYALILFNSVDMRYRNLQDPKVKLNIARIIVAMKPEGTPYIDSNMVNSNAVDSNKVVTSAGYHFYNHRESIPLNSYDVILLMTRHLLMVGSKDILGLAQFKGACSVNSGDEYVERVAIFHDDGSHWSLPPAHELAHLLGADHDYSECSYKDGYIMTPKSRPSINNWEFSKCSIEQIKNTIQENHSCLYNVPKNAGKILRTSVFDKYATHAEQCRLVFGTEPCAYRALAEEEFCHSLTCMQNGQCALRPGHNLAEGTPCGDGQKVCIRGKCVKHGSGKTDEKYIDPRWLKEWVN